MITIAYLEADAPAGYAAIRELRYGQAAEILAGTRATPENVTLRIERDRQFVGATLGTRWVCERIMSDVWDNIGYADVWNDEAGKIESIYLGGTDSVYCGYLNAVEVDATPEIVAKAEAWKVAQAAAAAKRQREYEEAREAATFRNGKRVEVVRGRKIPLGTEGVIFWMGHDNYGAAKLGIATTERKVNGRFADVVWVAQKNCEIIRAQATANA